MKKINYEKFLNDIIEVEGGYVDHPLDSGGPTNMGITLGTYFRSYSSGTLDTFQNMSRDEAKDIYWSFYVKPFILLEHHPVMLKFIVNSAVQHGVGAATRFLQKSAGVDQDGRIGNITKSAVEKMLGDDPGKFFAGLVAIRCDFYASILRRRTDQRVFAAGWLARLARDLT